ncbi:Uma2 family endonuclease [Chroococcidiopsis sp. CCMEE 29]|uniref:Uma2 family endonuclease n=1 Tax=Chroococcidiopsis sp. CCMEE 29 TaxID=155894 RepID=UPI00202180CF|nr:Uma2 family endonuclease [Chroococcidiopsis sp. CCMEE 29]
MEPNIIDLSPIINLTDEQFYHLATSQPDQIKLERTPTGEIVIVTPHGAETSNRNARVIAQVVVWADEHEDLGLAFDSDTEFNLPNGGNRSPDAAWISRERWEALTDREREVFPPICPDFVIELRSPTDRLKPLQDKMQEYLNSGLRLGWLINRQDKQVEVYRAGQEKEVLRSPATLSGEDVLPGFVLKLEKIWR